MQQQFLPVCAPTLAPALNSVTDLARLPVIRENAQLAGWSEWLAPHGLTPAMLSDGPELADGGLCLNAAMSGQGVFMAWAIIAADALAQGTLVRPLPGHAVTNDFHWLVTAPESHRKPAIGKFRDWLRAELSASLGTGV
ncbi:LysR substrate-binding domain-containing protein [Paracoccus sp. M683]|uniref:LysR substrate-binding domain-containing protein n=1 Tax=Paracoccus sp. M683 TaxID=2594268 RepID=UPI0021031F5B|nr:LysR substrate-binding domain-containing protein [Paracoccus sp. M683]